jgi:N6-adenosine-specific RNA methylase IME4
MGAGDWLRGQTEHYLMAIRGKILVNLTSQSTLLHAPRRGHSQKPEVFYALVEALCPDSKLDLFARVSHVGWMA